MPDMIENETYFTSNGDGSVSFDPWARKTREQLKRRCGDLIRAVDQWQQIAMTLYDRGKDGLLLEERAKVELLIEAYRDDIDTPPRS